MSQIARQPSRSNCEKRSGEADHVSGPPVPQGSMTPNPPSGVGPVVESVTSASYEPDLTGSNAVFCAHVCAFQALYGVVVRRKPPG